MLLHTILLCSVLSANAYKLLVVFPIPSKSHGILGEGFVTHLLKAGHEVTYVTPILIKESPGLQQIDVSENARVLSPEIFDVSKVLTKELNLQDYELWSVVMTEILNITFNSDNVQRLLNDKDEKFDAVIVEWLFTELGAGLSAIFNCPLIWSSSMSPHTYVTSLVNEHLNPAYTPTLLSTKFSFDFWDRALNLWTYLKIWNHKRQFADKETKVYEEVFGPAAALRGQKLPAFDEVRYNASLMFGNSHVSVAETIALPQNYKDIGGYHIKRNVDPLPQNLQQIMDNSRDGVIYFSLGSLLQPQKMPIKMKRDLLNYFSALKQTVIWKLGENLTDVPKNVHLFSWAPQQSILAHPNCVLFITHAGLLSILEAIYFGVPIIGLPFFADQFVNIERAVAKGFAKRLDFSYNSPVELNEAIKEILSNTSYRDRAKDWSSIYHDKLVSPEKELVFWVEHVIKTRGAKHLRSIALATEWYKKYYMDLLACSLLSIIVLSLALCKLLPVFKNNKKKTD
ncbi:UDP-glycosyltransferase UGT5-like [Aricia agestis]|uniref:UDP-glycosyltransferase UGT5-like n=1 Tax=Aricia agestis TaxID=91739 RepID=UPI001C2046D5|nr:UDP-glycosyltransferase UGT5-like [Aricia agestis]